jgi:hypothetical protein
MAQMNDNYSQLAADSRAAAAEQVLDNVREKHLTAAASWDRLAHANAKMMKLRAERLSVEAALTRSAAAAALVGPHPETSDEC